MKCTECVYFRRIEPDGECRRNPPVFRSDFRYGRFPAVHADMCCGEFRDGPGRIRLAWNVDGEIGESEWYPVGDRKKLDRVVESGCATYGDGTHWIESESY